MSLENDIHQSRRFRNEHHKALVNLLFTYNWAKEQLQQIFEKENLTLQQYNILRIVNGSETPLSTSEIRERMLDKMSDTSRVVDRMIEKKLLTKKINKNDKRFVSVFITTSGKRVMNRMNDCNREIDGIVNKLSVKEARILNTLMDKIRSSSS